MGFLMSMNALKTAALLGFRTAILLIGGQAIAGRQGLDDRNLQVVGIVLLIVCIILNFIFW